MPVPDLAGRLARAAGTPPALLGILDRLSSAHQVWIVGGAVDAWLNGTPTPDIDIVTTAPASALRTTGFVPIGGQHGTLALRRAGGRIEATPLEERLDDNLIDRDFRPWAIALPWPGGAAIDPCGGLIDRWLRLLRTPKPANATLERDPVRILRGLRRVAEGYRLHPRLAAAVRGNLTALASEPTERIGGEWLKVLAAPTPARALVAATAWPELLQILTGLPPEKLLAPPPDGHRQSIWRHTAAVIQRVPPGTLRLAAFFHDLGKAGGGRGHAIRSAELADERLRQWACPKTLRQRAVAVIAHHSFHIPSLLGDRVAMREWIAKIEPQLDDLLVFRRADRQAAGRWTRAEQQRLALFEMVARRELRSVWPRSPRELDLETATLFARIDCPPPLRARLLESLWRWVLAAPAARNQSDLLEHRAARLCLDWSNTLESSSRPHPPPERQ